MLIFKLFRISKIIFLSLKLIFCTQAPLIIATKINEEVINEEFKRDLFKKVYLS